MLLCSSFRYTCRFEEEAHVQYMYMHVPVSQLSKRMLPQTSYFAEFHRHIQLQLTVLCVFPTDLYVCICTCIDEHVHVDVCSMYMHIECVFSEIVCFALCFHDFACMHLRFLMIS